MVKMLPNVESDAEVVWVYLRIIACQIFALSHPKSL